MRPRRSQPATMGGSSAIPARGGAYDRSLCRSSSHRQHPRNLPFFVSTNAARAGRLGPTLSARGPRADHKGRLSWKEAPGACCVPTHGLLPGPTRAARRRTRPTVGSARLAKSTRDCSFQPMLGTNGYHHSHFAQAIPLRSWSSAPPGRPPIPRRREPLPGRIRRGAPRNRLARCERICSR